MNDQALDAEIARVNEHSRKLLNAYFLTRKQELEKEQKAGTTSCLAVKKYPRAKRHLMYIFEGLKDESEPGFMIPLHYFAFQDFYPETMRLKDEDYFDYYPPPP